MASQRVQTSRIGDGENSGASNDGGVLPRDALYEILLRVPAWAVCRFRTVCRSWRTLLSDPLFIAAHAAHHHRDPLFVVCGVAGVEFLDTSGRIVKQVDVGPSWTLWWIRPHLDLVLIHRRTQVEYHPLRVLDPTTGAISLLPVYDNYSAFAFGRAVSSMGGDGEYKVLRLSLTYTQFCQVLTVDCSGGGNHGPWRAAPGPPVTIKTLDRGTVVASGVVYNLVDSSNGWKIATFDLEAEQWRPDLLQGPVVPVPSVGNCAARRSLAEVNSRLAAVSYTDSTLDMWLLMGSGEQAVWCKRHRVLTSFVKHITIGKADVGAPQPLWVLDDGKVAFWLRSYVPRGGTLWMYDPRTQTCTHLADCQTIGVGVYTGNPLLLGN